MARCYSEEQDYSLEELREFSWQTGCALCGLNCWELPENKLKIIDDKLDNKEEVER